MRILPLIWFAELALVNARVLKHHQVGVEDTVPNLSLVNPAESRLTPVLNTQAPVYRSDASLPTGALLNSRTRFGRIGTPETDAASLLGGLSSILSAIQDPPVTTLPPLPPPPPPPPPPLSSSPERPNSFDPPPPSSVFSASHKSSTAISMPKTSQPTSTQFATNSSSLGFPTSSTSAHSHSSQLGSTNQVQTPTALSQITPSAESSTISASKGSKTNHATVLIGVLVPLLCIAVLIAVIIRRRRRRRHMPMDPPDPHPERTPDPPAVRALPDVPMKESQGWDSSQLYAVPFEKSTTPADTSMPNSAQNEHTLSRTQTLASSDWPETPLPRYARPLPKVPTA
ncbi:hypothetical protein B0H14DRAFT_2681469 [Mycena olivaceomarginata]|nr:hypothetical protein B0H14DRAFT_2681469 [Mycena olivaceomarginata]